MDRKHAACGDSPGVGDTCGRLSRIHLPAIDATLTARCQDDEACGSCEGNAKGAHMRRLGRGGAEGQGSNQSRLARCNPGCVIPGEDRLLGGSNDGGVDVHDFMTSGGVDLGAFLRARRGSSARNCTPSPWRSW
jgi:hypothetical protein